MADCKRPLIVLPTYNEIENISALVQTVLAQGIALDILIVDDNSPDGTGDVADELSRTYSNIHVLHRARKEGLGPAYIAGFQWAMSRDYDCVFEMDCDFSHDPIELPRFLIEIRHADLVIGSRYVRGGSTPDWGLNRRFLSIGGNFISRTVLRLRTRDCTGGYRCYRRDLLDRIPWEAISAQGYGFQVGAVYYAERLGARIREFPIKFWDRQVGRSKMSPHIVREALKYVFRLALVEVGLMRSVSERLELGVRPSAARSKFLPRL
jgi:dolichol-phosphate mannosyltransferase